MPAQDPGCAEERALRVSQPLRRARQQAQLAGGRHWPSWLVKEPRARHERGRQTKQCLLRVCQGGWGDHCHVSHSERVEFLKL